VSLDRASALQLVRVASQELDRAMKTMGIPGQPKPFFISSLLREEESWRIKAKYGSLNVDTHDRTRNGFIDVRVGSHRSDQLRDGGLDDNDKEAESYSYVDLPFGSSLDGLRHGLWRLTEARYRESLESLLDKKSHELTYLDPHRNIPAFEKHKPVVDLSWQSFPEVDHDQWAEYVERASATLKSCKGVKDSYVEFQAEHTCRILINSEGTRLLHCQPIWSVECYIWLLSNQGHSFPWTIKHMVTEPSELPMLAEFRKQIRAAVKQLRRLAKAPTVRSFSGPAWLDPVPAGLLIHEAVGHRLEGSRLLSTGEGQTFKDSLGRKILPEFLSIRDNPTLSSYDGKSLVGHYLYDDEGVPARDTELASKGVLKQFLTTRTAIARRHHSSGHARAQYHQRPISRMGVMVIETENGYDDREMKQLLLEEIRQQDVAFGIHILEASSGETTTDAYNFQAFLGEAGLAAKVYPDGREELVRGVNFVGTPLNAIRNITAAGTRVAVDNAFCGAESGYVPVSTISPGLIISELELQSKPEAPYTPYNFLMPWE